MRTNRPTLTDDLLRQGLTELAAGPEAGELLADVLRTLDATPQAGGLMWRPAARRPAMMLLAAAVILVALVGAVAILSGVLPPPVPAPFVPQNIVVQHWNDLREDEFQITHSAVAPTGEPADVAPDALPTRAGFVRWSPDGERLTYFEVAAPPELRGYSRTGLFIADADGSNPLRVSAPRGVDMYDASGWFNGAHWAPSGSLVALGWNTGGCQGGPDCLPDAGIDIFGADGQMVAAIVTPDVPALQPVWSPDSERIGWLTGSCADSLCVHDAFHWQFVEGDEIYTVPLGPDSSVVWSASDRLLVVTMNTVSETSSNVVRVSSTVERVYSIAPDGSDEQDVAWEAGATGWPVWSPDGRRIVISDSETGRLTIRDARSAEEVVVAVPTGLNVAMWSPESDRVVLFGGLETSSNFALYTINVDGTGLVPVGEAWDFAWMPTSSAVDPSEPPAASNVAPEPIPVPDTAFFPQFTYRIPPDSGLGLTSPIVRRNELHFDVDDTDVSGNRGVVVLSIFPGLVAHTCAVERIQVSDGSPSELIDDLRERAGFGFGAPTQTTVDGLPAVVTDLAYGDNQCEMTDLHLKEGIGGLLGYGLVLADGAKVLVVDAHGTLVAIEIWAGSPDDMDSWLPTALEFVNSIHFVSEVD